jgi:hypothetical protein
MLPNMPPNPTKMTPLFIVLPQTTGVISTTGGSFQEDTISYDFVEHKFCITVACGQSIRHLSRFCIGMGHACLLKVWSPVVFVRPIMEAIYEDQNPAIPFTSPGAEAYART